MKQAILITLILFGSTFLIYETAHFCMAQGLPHWLCWMTAAMLEGGCIIAATYKDKFARIIVCCFVGFVLFASSYGRIDPLLTADKTTAGQNRLISAMDANIASLETRLADLNKQGQRLNYATTNKELTNAQKERTQTLKQLNASPQATISMAVMALRSWGIVALRLFVQIFNIFLASRLTLKKTQPQLSATDAGQTPQTTKAEQDQQIDLDQPSLKLYKYIDQRGGQVKRRNLLSSRILKGAPAYDTAINSLRDAGYLTISTNGKIANTTYSI